MSTTLASPYEKEETLSNFVFDRKQYSIYSRRDFSVKFTRKDLFSAVIYIYIIALPQT